MGIMSEEVLVTGASGFIATHVVKQLQAAGYKVRGTVRSLKNDDKVAPLRQLCPDAKYPIELVEADLLNPDSWEKAVKGCKFVMHTASPLPLPGTSKDPENEVIKPAVEGTNNVLKACLKAKVKRVVVTSSVAAITETGDFTGRKATEADWTDPDKAPPYTKSKTLAEKAAWDLVANQPDGEKMELSVVNPVFVLGPPLCGGGGGASITLTKMMIIGDLKEVPASNIGIVDVRDVARAHLKAMTLPEAAGKRFIVTSRPAYMIEIANIFSGEFKKYGYNCSDVGKREGGSNVDVDNTRMKKVLGIEQRPIEETIIAMGYGLIERGFVKKTDKYTGVPTSVKMD